MVGEDLDRLGQYLAAALAEQQDDQVRAALAEVERGLLVHQRALAGETLRPARRGSAPGHRRQVKPAGARTG